MVIRTGFVTTKGALVRDILYPRETKFKFYQDSLTFVGVMAIVSVVGFACTVPYLIANDATPLVLLDKSLDLITITVPPALPATMSAGVAFAVQRLKRSKIYCISPPRVNLSGRIQIFVFDKTGTLTEDGLRILGLRGIMGGFVKNSVFTEFVPSLRDLPMSEPGEKISLMTEAMASCHAITYVNDDLVGDPLEIEMFRATDWQLDE